MQLRYNSPQSVLLRAWARECGAEGVFDRACVRFMRGGPKKALLQQGNKHFQGVMEIIPSASRLILFDYDTDDAAFHPPDDNPTLFEWKRKNIQNYLLVPEAWLRAVTVALGDLFAQPLAEEIRTFFVGENLLLPPGQSWRSVRANVFQAVDGKRLLFDNEDSLFHRLQASNVELTPETIADHRTAVEIHEDVHRFFEKLKGIVRPAPPPRIPEEMDSAHQDARARGRSD